MWYQLDKQTQDRIGTALTSEQLVALSHVVLTPEQAATQLAQFKTAWDGTVLDWAGCVWTKTRVR